MQARYVKQDRVRGDTFMLSLERAGRPEEVARVVEARRRPGAGPAGAKADAAATRPEWGGVDAAQEGECGGGGDLGSGPKRAEIPRTRPSGAR